MSKLVQDLKSWALSHYNEGGHWVYETYEDADYEAALKGGFKAAKKELKAQWSLMNEMSSNCAFE